MPSPTLILRSAATAASTATASAAKSALPNLFSLAGKSIVITGASGGMATVICRYLLNSGVSSLALLDQSASSLEKTAKHLQTEHSNDTTVAVAAAGHGKPKITTWECDISDQDQVRQVMQSIRLQNEKPLDALVNTAGYCENISALDYPGDKISRVLDVNLMGSMVVATEFARTVITDLGVESAIKAGAAGAAKQETLPTPSTIAGYNKPMGTTASIILIASMSGHIVNHPQFQTPYNMSKAGVMHLAKSLASEWAPYGIRVNSLSPGYIMTPLTKSILDANPVLRDKWEGQIPMGRMADPAEFAGPIIYMASDASSYMTGADMLVDGGYCVR